MQYTISPFRRIYQSSYYITAYCKNVLHERTNFLTLFQLQQKCTHTRISAEEKLGIEKPKKPLNPFFKFMTQIRPALNAKIPGISCKEAVIWSSKHWQQLDNETKSQMKNEYENDLESYRKKKAIYEATLTKAQKEDIKRINEERIASREKRKLKSKLKEMGKPKKPISSYILYAQSRNDVFQGKEIKDYQQKVRTGWLSLPISEKVKFDQQAQELMKKYKKDVEVWELKMISMGHSHLVRQKPQKKKSKNVTSK